MITLRRLWWRHIRRYAFEICDRCGRPSARSLGPLAREAGYPGPVPQTYWFAQSYLWNLVMGGPSMTDDPGGVLCPSCFTQAADDAGKPIGWVAAEVGEVERLERRRQSGVPRP